MQWHFTLCIAKKKNRNTLLIFFLLSLLVLEHLHVDPAEIRRGFAVHCPQCLADCSEAALLH